MLDYGLTLLNLVLTLVTIICSWMIQLPHLGDKIKVRVLTTAAMVGYTATIVFTLIIILSDNCLKKHCCGFCIPARNARKMDYFLDDNKQEEVSDGSPTPNNLLETTQGEVDIAV